MFAVNCQLDSAPPTVWVERNWKIPESEAVGNKIAQAHGSAGEGVSLIYSLEPLNPSENLTEKLPFSIDPYTGVVFLNESLKGRVSFALYFSQYTLDVSI